MNYYQGYQPNYFSQQQQYYQSQTLSGCVVENIDTVKCQPIPVGTFGIFPKADLSNIYLKAWNNDGTTRIIVYQPLIEKEETITDIDEIKKSIDDLYKKIDEIKPLSNNRKKKEGSDE